jgi:hypothetical protein
MEGKAMPFVKFAGRSVTGLYRNKALLDASLGQRYETGFENCRANALVLVFGQHIKPYQFGPVLGRMVALQKMAEANHLLVQIGHVKPMIGRVYRVGQVFGPVGSFQEFAPVFRSDGLIVGSVPGYAGHMGHMGQVGMSDCPDD